LNNPPYHQGHDPQPGLLGIQLQGSLRSKAPHYQQNHLAITRLLNTRNTTHIRRMVDVHRAPQLGDDDPVDRDPDLTH